MDTFFLVSMENAKDVCKWKSGLDVTLAHCRGYWMELANWRGNVCMNMRDVFGVEDIERVVSEWQWLAFMEAN